ncbi:MAG: cupin domain-containing protein [Gaiellaceae bacterium]
MKHLAHWDDVKPRRREAGHIVSTWYDLGSAADSVDVGVQRIVVEPGKWSTPAHAEGAEEEIFFVLAGSGISWQDGEVYEVGAGDCLVHLPEEKAHTLRAGPDGLEVLAFGQRKPQGNTVLPRAGVAWMHPSWVDVGGPTPWDREAAAGEPEVGELSERTAGIVNVADGIRYELPTGAVDLNLGDPAGSLETGLSHMTLQPGEEGYVPHCHSAEEELFFVLEGSGAAFLGDESANVRAGSIVSRPAGTSVPHSFRAGGDGLVYLAYGTREPNDIVFYPRAG